MPSYSRRSLLKYASGMALAGLANAPMVTPPWIERKPRFISYPFTLGVASGDPMPGGAVIWTRLAPNPLDPDATGREPIPVRYEVALDQRFKRVVNTGGVVAYHANAHSVHVPIEGLMPGRPYFYRFMAGDEVSRTGRLVTAPAVGASVDQFRFAVASCQQYEMGYFSAYQDMIAQDVSLIVHLGDYIYESSWNGPARRMPVSDARSLTDYRALHAIYKTDSSLQDGHAFAPFISTWDDHEVVNDYAAEFDENYEPPETFLKRRAAAYKAYYEHMPLRATATPVGPDMRLYQRLFFGDMVEFNMLDTRQYRTDHPCQTPEEGGWQKIDATCEERFDPNRTILGKDQERWFLGRFGRAGCRWNIMAQGMLFSKHDYKRGEGEEIGSEYWDGYVESRNRVIKRVQDRDIKNAVCIGGDVHATYVCDVKADFDDINSDTVMSEFVTTSVSSPNDFWQWNAQSLPDNPHIVDYTGEHRGYTLMDLTKDRMQVDMRAVKDVMDPQSTAFSAAKYVVENGKPGPQQA